MYARFWPSKKNETINFLNPWYSCFHFFFFFFWKPNQAGLNTDELKTADKQNQNFNGTQRTTIYDNENNSLVQSSSSPPLPLSSDLQQERKKLPSLRTVRLDNEKTVKESLPTKAKSRRDSGCSTYSISPHERNKISAPISDREWFEGQRFNPFNTEVVFEEDHYSEVGSTSKDF